jgi:formylglycine-generating enzyme
LRSLLLIAALLVALPAAAVDIEYVAVRDPGNPADTATNCLNDAPDCGSVPYNYAISKYEITNAQYAEFLNAVAASDDPFGLYNPPMSISLFFDLSTGMFVYSVPAGSENNPVVLVSWYDALRFANWLHNGQPTGAQEAWTTEDGAYTFPVSADAPRNAGANAFLPTESEWYKAAYYDPALPGYYEYPAGADAETICAAPGSTPNTANCNFGVGAVAAVGAYTGSPSPYGTFDQGGNVWEWNEQVVSGSYRGIRGGGFASSGPAALAASSPNFDGPGNEDENVGFRVARPVPEPTQVLLVLTGGLVLAVVRKRHAKAL